MRAEDAQARRLVHEWRQSETERGQFLVWWSAAVFGFREWKGRNVGRFAQESIKAGNGYTAEQLDDVAAVLDEMRKAIG